MTTGFVVFAHGSSIASANDAVRAVAVEMARRGGFPLVEAAFLEGGSPDLAGAVERLAARAASRVVVIPYFLTLGLHLHRDLPRIVEGLSRIHPGMEIVVTPPLDGHPALCDVLLARARESLD
ncbi:MAG: CbiX/SirB N-terminal domain-containing protein [Acidobacteria bacterium]|nr:CbiX/SirB N-terminal domain-containing protein [Acidobacteriota bacterium]